jgi:hypothetical protein
VISQSGTSGRGDQAQLWLVERPDGTAYTRRMMPIEHERLQGLPDGYTQIAYAGRDPDDCSDALRYKAVGNSVAVPVVRAIAAAADAALADVIGLRAVSEPARAEIAQMGAWPVVAVAPANADAPDHALANVDAPDVFTRPAAHVAFPWMPEQPAEPAWRTTDSAVAEPVLREFPDPADAVHGGRASPRGSRAPVPDVAVDENGEAPRAVDGLRRAGPVARVLVPGHLDGLQPRAQRRHGTAVRTRDRPHRLSASVRRERVGQRAASSGRPTAVGEARPPPGRVRPTSAARIGRMRLPAGPRLRRLAPSGARHRACARRARAPTATAHGRGHPAATISA